MLLEVHPLTPLEDLVGDLRFEFTDAPERTLTHYLRRAATIMCREGDFARRKAIVETTPGVEAYRPELGGEVELAAVLAAVDLDGRRPVPRLARGPEAGWPGPGLWLVFPDELHYRENTIRRRRLEVELSVVPSAAAAAIDRDLGERHYEVLLAGARSLLYSVGGKPWTSPELAGMNHQLFMNGIAAAKISDVVGRQKGLWRNANERVL